MEAIDCWRRRRRRGSALILVLIVILALSAMGILVIDSVGETTRRTGAFRVRSQAHEFAEATARFTVKRVGDNSSRYIESLSRSAGDEMRGATMANRRRIASRGGYARFVHESSAKGGGTAQRAFGRLLEANGEETGLFTNDPDGTSSFETRSKRTRFEVVVRDPVGGLPVPGYSKEFCFKKVTIAARGQIGSTEAGWNTPQQVGVGRTVTEALVGPGRCGE